MRESQPTLWGHASRVPGRGWRGAVPPLTPAAERAAWHAKARSAGLTLSDLVRRSIGRVRTWTVAHAEVERERTRELARVGNNLNQIARWTSCIESTTACIR